MPTYVALLRGVNVGGRRSVPMATLRSLHESLGHGGVTTYIQSGNVVFDSMTTEARALSASIESAIVDRFGFDVRVVLRSDGELLTAVEGNPYPGRGADLTRVAITFAQQEPTPGNIRTIDPTPHHPDEFTIDGRDIHLHCPSGFGRTILTNAFFERQLGVVATTRNWRTVNKLLELTNR